MRTFPNKCHECGTGTMSGIHTGPVPPMAEIIKRGPVGTNQLDWSVLVCSPACATQYRAKERSAARAAGRL